MEAMFEVTTSRNFL